MKDKVETIKREEVHAEAPGFSDEKQLLRGPGVFVEKGGGGG